MIVRQILSKIKEWIDKKKILILKGARQVGKTTLLFMLKDYLESNGRQVEYFACDQELGNPLFINPKALIKYIKESYRSSTKKLYILLDEFQYIDDAGLFLKIVFDATYDVCQIIVSGSSSLEIAKSSEYLTGRKITFDISGISFKEYLEFKEKKYTALASPTLDDIQDYLDAYTGILKSRLSDYLSWSSYPEIIIESNREHRFMLLKDIISTYLQKDIAGYLHINNIKEFNNLINILAAQIGNLVNTSELSNTLSITHETVKKYLAILEGTYVVDFIKPYYTNVRKEITKMPKVYVNDIGLYNLLSKKGQELFDYGQIEPRVIENYVYLVLKQLYGRENINFYRTISKSEIDFILCINNELIPIEVKFVNNIRKQLPLPMKNFEKLYKGEIAKKIIITKDYFEANEEQKIYYIPVYAIEFLVKLVI